MKTKSEIAHCPSVLQIQIQAVWIGSLAITPDLDPFTLALA